MEKVFVLGLGAQKAETTWLHQYLSSFKFANFGFTKEYHIWDAVYSPVCRNFLEPSPSGPKIDTGRFLRHCMQNVDGFYEDYFSSILNSGFRMTGDISPSYCVLDAAQLREVRHRLSRMNVKIRVVFLMRDPFERCWSAVRMAKRDRNNVTADEVILQKSYSRRQFTARTRYEVICENIRAAFSEEEIYFGLYERMFDPAEVARLSHFLGVKARPSLVEKRANSTVKVEQISDSLKEDVRRFYSATYLYCWKNFPESKGLWTRT